MYLWSYSALGWAFCTAVIAASNLTRIGRLHYLAPPISYTGWKGQDYCRGREWTYWKPQCAKPTATEAVGVSDWDTKFKMCGDSNQSPISITFMQTSFKDFEPIQFSGYDVPFQYIVENGGNAVYLTPQEADLESYGGPLTVRYNLSKGVFHFGNGSGHGSEHTIDRQQFAAELQLLISSERPTTSSCIEKGNGLAIFVILFQKQTESNPQLEPFINATERLQSRGNWSALHMPLSHFLPNTTLRYYLYPGSLTFPPCTTGATVIVFSNPVGIGDAQLLRLRSNLFVFMDKCKYTVAGNLRPAVDTNKRQIFRSFKFNDESSSAPSIPGLNVLTALAAAVLSIAYQKMTFSPNLTGRSAALHNSGTFTDHNRVMRRKQ